VGTGKISWMRKRGIECTCDGINTLRMEEGWMENLPGVHGGSLQQCECKKGQPQWSKIHEDSCHSVSRRIAECSDLV
jgi:hypothetical protein